MLKRIIILSALIGIPAIIWIATRYGTTPPITFAQALKQAESASESESAKKVLIRGYVIIDASHPLERNNSTLSFTLRDDAMQEFRVQYDGQETIGALENMQKIGIAGHTHGGDKPYFHAKQIILSY